MCRLRAVLRLTTLLFGFFCSIGTTKVFAIETGEMAINFSLTSNSGQIASLDKYNGKVVYLDFWASWCPSCRRSLSWLNDLQKKYGKRGLEIVAVNLDSDSEAALKTIRELQLDLPILFDPQGSTAESYQVKSMPSSYLLGPNGKVMAVYEGFKESKQQEVEQQIVELLPQ